MGQEIVNSSEARMQKSLDSTKNEISAQRTGRANPAVLDNIKVDYYGTLTPLSQTANISVPEPRTIAVHPWDKNMVTVIEKAILEANIGLTPVNNGTLLRLPIPELTEDRRKDIVKQIKRMGEDGKIAIRNIRRDGNEALKKKEKDKEIGEDNAKTFQDDVQKITDKFISEVDGIISAKEKEIMEI